MEVLFCVWCGDPFVRKSNKGPKPRYCSKSCQNRVWRLDKGITTGIRKPPGLMSDPTDPRHGTANGYSNQNCHCDRCKEAWRVTHLNYMRSHPEQQEKQRARNRQRYYEQKRSKSSEHQFATLAPPKATPPTNKENP